MNLNCPTYMKYATVGLTLTAALFGVGEAKADVNWSVGINVPGVVVGAPAPVYYEPAPLII